MGGRRLATGDLPGFTLIELVVVVALLGILLVLTLPSYTNYASNQRAVAAAQTLAADLRVARQEAVTRRATITATFVADDDACHQAPRTSRQSIASYAILHGDTVIKRTCFPPDVVWSPFPPISLAFQSVGSPRAGAIITVRSALTGREHAVTVAAESGAVTDAPR